MIGLYILAGIIIFFWLLLSVSAGIRVIYNSADAENTRVYLQIGFYKFYIVPLKLKQKKAKKKGIQRRKVKQITEKKVGKKREKKKEKREKYKIGEIIGFARDIGLILFKKLRKYLKIKIYKADIKVGAEDAYKTAMLYANINQAAYYLHEILKNNFNLRAENINISADFLSGKLNFDIDVKISMKLGAGLNILVAAAMNFLKFWSKNKSNNNKKKESENQWQTAT